MSGVGSPKQDRCAGSPAGFRLAQRRETLWKHDSSLRFEPGSAQAATDERNRKANCERRSAEIAMTGDSTRIICDKLRFPAATEGGDWHDQLGHHRYYGSSSATAANGSSKAAVAHAVPRASCMAFEPESATFSWGSAPNKSAAGSLPPRRRSFTRWSRRWERPKGQISRLQV
jgi:hypothetical protein